MLNTLKLFMEKRMLKITADDKALIAQINEQQYEYLQPKTAQERIHLKFWHPQGKHDDQLMALGISLPCSFKSSATRSRRRYGRRLNRKNQNKNYGKYLKEKKTWGRYFHSEY